MYLGHVYERIQENVEQIYLEVRLISIYLVFKYELAYFEVMEAKSSPYTECFKDVFLVII